MFPITEHVALVRLSGDELTQCPICDDWAAIVAHALVYIDDEPDGVVQLWQCQACGSTS